MIPIGGSRAGVIALVAAMVAGAVGPLGLVLGGPPGTTGAATSAPPTASVPPVPFAPSTGAPPASPSTSGSPANLAEAMAATALAQTRAAGLSPRYAFVPRPSADPAQIAAARARGTVEPLYASSPAPMGLADYGLSEGPGGQVVGSILNTTSLVGTVDLNSTGVQADDLFQSSPDSFAVQLNAVLTNVTLFGRPGYSFWTQNVVEYYPMSGFVVLVSNIWNFSSGPLSANDFYRLGPHGAVVGSEYYAAVLPLGTPTDPAVKLLPFDLTLWLNSSVVQGRDAVNFTVQLRDPSFAIEDFTEAYDGVVFNSIPHGSVVGIARPSPFTANGEAYNPVGLTDDFELTIGGPGGGSQATLFDADATLGLGYWTGGGYAAVPSAYNYGGETGETSTGADVTWGSDFAAAPLPWLTYYGAMSTGPSLLTGLWGAGGPEGSYPVTLNVDPQNAFNIVTPVGGSSNFSENGSAIAPGAYTNTYYLAPGNYSLLTELSDYEPVTTPLNVTGPTQVSVDLVPDLSLGIYTPLWAFSDVELGELSTSGIGTTASPYLMPAYQPSPLSGIFGLYNPYGFPAYPGVFFQNTTATTELVDPPSFAAVTNISGPEKLGLPAENGLQYWFSDASNVALLDAANISDWFSAWTFFPASFNSFSVIFYASTADLVANDTFASGSGGLLVYAGTALLAPTAAVGGSGTTIWGNTFEGPLSAPVCPGASGCNVTTPSRELGLELAGPGNTVYNNAVRTPTTAWVVPMNLGTGAKEVYDNAFNITPQPASIVHTVPSFPSVPLYGSIVGTRYQGGNFWWDYGLALNPYNGAVDPFGTLPYDEKATTYLASSRGYYPPGYYDASYIYPGGDDAPLVPYSLYPVTLEARGLPKTTGWTVTVTNASGVLMAALTASGPSHTVELPNGSYHLLVSPAGVHYTEVALPFSVAGASVSIPVTFYTLTFREAGLPTGRAWTLVFNGTSRTLRAAPTAFYVANGSYPYLIQGPSRYVPSGLSGPGTATVSGASFVQTVTFVKGPTYVLAFREKGLGKGADWCVAVSVSTICTTRGTAVFAGLAGGTYPYVVLRRTNLPAVTAALGTAAVPLNGTIALDRNTRVTLTYGNPNAVTFVETGLPSGGSWSVKVGSTTLSNATGASTVFELLNGTYAYKVTVAGVGVAGGESGKVKVEGTATTVDLVWYPVTFTETGLINGTSWCVTVGKGSACSPTPSIVAYEGNGSYSFRIWSVKGYTSVATPTKITVSGAGTVVTVTFAPKAAKAS